MVLEAAAHEDEIFLDAVGDPKAEDVLIELRGRLRVGRAQRDVTELVDDKATERIGRLAELPLRKKFDAMSVRIAERQRFGNAGQAVASDFRCDTAIGEGALQFAEIGIRGNLERDRAEMVIGGLLDDGGELVGVAAEVDALAVAADDAEPDHGLIVFQQVLQIGGCQRRMSDPFHPDHRVILQRLTRRQRDCAARRCSRSRPRRRHRA